MRKILVLIAFLCAFSGFSQGEQLKDTLRYNKLSVNKVKQTVDVYMLTTVYRDSNYSVFNFYDNSSDRLLYSFKAVFYYDHQDRSTSFECRGEENKTFILHFSPNRGAKGVIIKYPLTEQKIIYFNEDSVEYIPKQKI